MTSVAWTSAARCACAARPRELYASVEVKLLYRSVAVPEADRTKQLGAIGLVENQRRATIENSRTLEMHPSQPNTKSKGR